MFRLVSNRLRGLGLVSAAGLLASFAPPPAPPSLTEAAILRHDEAAYWELSARFPVAAPPRVPGEAALNAAVQAWVDAFVAHAEATMATHPVMEMADGPSRARLSYDISSPAPGIVEIRLDARIDYGRDLMVPSGVLVRLDQWTGAVATLTTPAPPIMPRR